MSSDYDIIVKEEIFSELLERIKSCEQQSYEIQSLRARVEQYQRQVNDIHALKAEVEQCRRSTQDALCSGKLHNRYLCELRSNLSVAITGLQQKLDNRLNQLDEKIETTDAKIRIERDSHNLSETTVHDDLNTVFDKTDDLINLLAKLSQKLKIDE